MAHGTVLLNHVGGSQTGQPAGYFPGIAAHQTGQQPGAVGIAAAGRINQTVGRRSGHIDAEPAPDHCRSLRGPCHHDGVHQLQHRLFVHAGLLARHLELVFVDRQHAGAAHRLDQLLAVHARQLLARVKDERDAELAALLWIGVHGRRIVGRDDHHVDQRAR